MAYYYYDRTGKKGPFNQTQLQIQVNNRKVIKETPVETDDGQSGQAGQLVWLVFPPDRKRIIFGLFSGFGSFVSGILNAVFLILVVAVLAVALGELSCRLLYEVSLAELMGWVQPSIKCSSKETCLKSLGRIKDSYSKKDKEYRDEHKETISELNRLTKALKDGTIDFAKVQESMLEELDKRTLVLIDAKDLSRLIDKWTEESKEPEPKEPTPRNGNDTGQKPPGEKPIVPEVVEGGSIMEPVIPVILKKTSDDGNVKNALVYVDNKDNNEPKPPFRGQGAVEDFAPALPIRPASPIRPGDDNVYYFNTTFVGFGKDFKYYILYIDSNNTAYITWSYNAEYKRDWKNKEKIMENVRSVYVLSGHMKNSNMLDYTYYLITTNNDLYAFGGNSYGQIGDDTGLNKSSPVLVMKDVANLYFESKGRSADHNDLETTFAIKTDKSRWVWGRNAKNNDQDAAFAPIKVNDYFNHNQQLLTDHISMKNDNPETYPFIELPDEIKRQLGGKDNIVSAISSHSNDATYYALTKDGVLWGWGHNNGRLGDGTRADRDMPVKIAENVRRILPKFFVTQFGDWYSYSGNAYSPQITYKDCLYVYYDTWLTTDGKLMEVRGGNISDIKLPSIVEVSSGRNVALVPKFLPRSPEKPVVGKNEVNDNNVSGGNPPPVPPNPNQGWEQKKKDAIASIGKIVEKIRKYPVTGKAEAVSTLDKFQKRIKELIDELEFTGGEKLIVPDKRRFGSDKQDFDVEKFLNRPPREQWDMILYAAYDRSDIINPHRSNAEFVKKLKGIRMQLPDKWKDEEK